MYISDMYVRGKKLKMFKNNSLWYFNGFLYDSSWRYDLATPWSIFHKNVQQKDVNSKSKWTFSDLCIRKRCNYVKIWAFKDDEVILCFYPDEAVSKLAVTLKASLLFASFESLYR